MATMVIQHCNSLAREETEGRNDLPVAGTLNAICEAKIEIYCCFWAEGARTGVEHSQSAE